MQKFSKSIIEVVEFDRCWEYWTEATIRQSIGSFRHKGGNWQAVKLAKKLVSSVKTRGRHAVFNEVYIYIYIYIYIY
jgi:hypothetical protein